MTMMLARPLWLGAPVARAEPDQKPPPAPPREPERDPVPVISPGNPQRATHLV